MGYIKYKYDTPIGYVRPVAIDYNGRYGNLFAKGGPKDPPKTSRRTTPYIKYNIKGMYPEGSYMPLAQYTGVDNPSRQAVEYQVNRLHYVENNANKGYNPSTQRYVAYDSPEGGTPTVGDGLKLNPGEKWTAVYNRQGYLTKEQHDTMVRERVQADYNATKKAYERVNGSEGAFDRLSPEWQAYLMDFNYNPGITRFPNLMRAVYNKDIDTIKRESSRKMTTPSGETLPLGRNKIMLNDVDLIVRGEYNGEYGK